MKAPTAKDLRAAACSVTGARSMGIETAASKAAPELLRAAEAWISKVSAAADQNAIAGRGGRQAAMLDGIESAAAELRAALNV